MLSENKPSDEVVELDVSFILKFLGKLSKSPLEIKLIEYYSLRINKEHDTIASFKAYLRRRFKVESDVELFKILNKRLYVKTALKVKAVMDSLIYLNYGSEVVDAKFISFVKATNDVVIIKMEIMR